jgi:spermidine synthase
MKTLYLYFAVWISGGAVLAIEILGTRVLGPFYGVSLFLWSALITVALVALSVGYALGGRLADRKATLPRLSCLMAGAGVWLLVLPWLKDPILQMTESIGLRFAVLVTSSLLFVPPLTLLGMVSPFAIRLRVMNLKEVGRTAGDLYAISTIGSVIAALATGFFLIPNFGIRNLTLAVGLVLLATAWLALVVAGQSKAVALTGGLALLACGLLVWRSAEAESTPGTGLQAIVQSPYGELRVVDQDGARHLLIDGGIHTVVSPSNYESYFPYVHVLDSTRHLFADRGELLLIGLGGGSVVKQFAAHGWNIDAIEIDPAVIQLASRYFGLRQAEANVFPMDGRRFLIQSDKQYDLIILDAFGSSSIPFHLVTREAFDLVAGCLRTGGVFAVNLESVGWRDPLVNSIAATLGTQFNEVLALPMAEPPNTLGNLILLASHRPIELLRELPPVWDRFSSAYHQHHAWDNCFAPDLAGAPVLTDDRNPVDLWAERINLAARKSLHQYFETEGVGW